MVGERVSSHDMQIQYIEQIQYIHRASSEIQYIARDSKHMVGERVSSHDMQIQYIEQIQYIHRADSIHGW